MAQILRRSHESGTSASESEWNRCVVPIRAPLTPEQIDQIATAVRNNILDQLDMEVCRAMDSLGIDAEISDDDWQAITDQVFS